MKATAKLVSISQASDLINSGKYLNIAGDEAALTQLPKGNWIGGTIPYFMADEGGTVSRDRVFVNEIEAFGDAPTIRFYDVESLPQLCRNAPENGYTLLVVPAFGPCHSAFAENAPNYEEMYMKPLIGWVAGVHLDDLGKTTPKVVLGTTGELSDQHVVAMDVPLPPEKFAHIDIVNLFQPGEGEAITFDDVLLLPRRSDFIPSDADVRTRLTRTIELNIPLLSAPMDTVTESALAIALAPALARDRLLMDQGWIATYGSQKKMSVQISFASQGGSDTPTPELSIEVDDVDATLKALSAFAGGLWVILGGKDKGNDYSGMLNAVRKNVRAIVAVGHSAEKIVSNFKGTVPVERVDTIGMDIPNIVSMQKTVAVATALAHRGDVVLLSPACTSFDWFTDFEERGRVFKSTVQLLASN